MKVYSCPDDVPAPEPDFKNYDHAREQAREEAHQAKLKAWLMTNGYGGKRTGEIVRFGVADGHASYMFGDGKKCCLIHLPYGDAYDYRDVQFLPKSEIVRRIDQQKGLATLFSRAG